MSTRAFILVAALALAACSKDPGQCATVASDPQWQTLTSDMNLPDYRQRRLNDYVSTLESAGCQVAQMDGPSRQRGAANLDAEIARSLPLFVPAVQVQKAHEFLTHTLRLQ